MVIIDENGLEYHCQLITLQYIAWFDHRNTDPFLTKLNRNFSTYDYEKELYSRTCKDKYCYHGYKQWDTFKNHWSE